MRLRKNKKKKLIAIRDQAYLDRDDCGVVRIFASDEQDMYFAQGWMHAYDRKIQVSVGHLLGKGRLAECLSNDQALIDLDVTMRRLNLYGDAQDQVSILSDQARKLAQAYCDGYNASLQRYPIPLEFRLVGYEVEPITIADIILSIKVMGFVGLSQTQGELEKFIISMIQKGVSRKKIRELFPNASDNYAEKIINQVKLIEPIMPVIQAAKLGGFSASNNWAVASWHSESGQAICCNDPHLDVNRLAPVWVDNILQSPDNYWLGASIPGIPGIILGRNRFVSWGATYSYIDTIDYFIEECHQGKFRDHKGWQEFDKREETIRIKDRPEKRLTFYENQRGVLEGNAAESGYYLNFCWASRLNCGGKELNNLFSLQRSRDCLEGMDLIRDMEFAAFSWTLADTYGNIGLQTSGRLLKRPWGKRGLLPLLGWRKRQQHKGLLDKSHLPRIYNPRNGIIVTANNNPNGYKRLSTANMGPHRHDRILELLLGKEKLSKEDMRDIQMDTYSPQAKELLRVLKPHLVDNEELTKLSHWDCFYHGYASKPTLFENIYRFWLQELFSSAKNLGEKFDFVLDHTAIVNIYYDHFDSVLKRKRSSWLHGRKQKDVIKRAIARALKEPSMPYEQTRMVSLQNLFFRDKLPQTINKKITYGPFALRGSRATICQGQIIVSHGLSLIIAPSYRFIADMKDNQLLTTLPGGPSDRPFSRFYQKDLENWLHGRHKSLRPDYD